MAVFQSLQKWQSKNQVTDEELAVEVSKILKRDIHRTTVSRAKRGLRVLGMDIQLAIQKHTGIPPSDWADFYAETVDLRRPKGEAGKKAGQRPFAQSKAESEAA